MIKKFFFILFFSLISFSSFSHLEHYKNLKKFEFNLYRNDNLIGQHIYFFEKDGNKLIVKSEINFTIKKLGIELYKYNANGTETYIDEKLVSFTSKTNQNGKEKYVNMKLEGNQYIIDGSSYKGKVSDAAVIGTWWNHSIVDAKAQVSAVSGRIIKQNVKFIGKENIDIDGKKIKTLHFIFTSSDKKLDKDKRLNTHIWYDEKNLNWIKASFKKKGNWEYRLKSATFK